MNTVKTITRMMRQVSNTQQDATSSMPVASCFFRQKAAFSALIVLISLIFPTQSWSSFDEFEVKSAFLYHLPAFMTWKETRDKNDFYLCTYRPNPKIKTYSVLDGKLVGNAKIRFIEVENQSQLQDCDLVFVTAEAERLDSDLRRRFPLPNVLAVGETRQFIRDGGGAIALIRKGDKVHIEISLAKLEQAGLSADSQLLEVATIVDTDS